MAVISNKARSSHWLFNLTEEEMKYTSRMYKLDPACRNRWCLQSSPVPGSTLLGMFWDNAPPPLLMKAAAAVPPLFLSSEPATMPSIILPYCDGNLPTPQGKASSHQDLILFAVCAWVTVSCLLSNPWGFTLCLCSLSPLIAFPSQSH